MTDQWNGSRSSGDENKFKQPSLKISNQGRTQGYQQSSSQYGNSQYNNGQYGGGRYGGKSPKNNTLMIFGVVALIAIILAAVGAILYFTMQDGGCASTTPPIPVTSAPPVTTPPVTTPPVTTPPVTTPPPTPTPTPTPPPTTPPPTPTPESPLKRSGRSIYSASELSRNDIVTFGEYPQTEYGSVRAIEWIVVAVNGNEVTLISRKVLDTMPMHDKKVEYRDIPFSFKNSTLYSWLNDGFKYTAFSGSEREMLKGSVTLPTLQEVKSLLSKSDRAASGTAYALQKRIDYKFQQNPGKTDLDQEDIDNTWLWWLGEVTMTQYDSENDRYYPFAYCEIEDGSDAWEYKVSFHGKGVRPMIVIRF